jgi:hypothetical protein
MGRRTAWPTRLGRDRLSVLVIEERDPAPAGIGKAEAGFVPGHFQNLPAWGPISCGVVETTS